MVVWDSLVKGKEICAWHGYADVKTILTCIIILLLCLLSHFRSIASRTDDLLWTCPKTCRAAKKVFLSS